VPKIPRIALASSATLIYNASMSPESRTILFVACQAMLALAFLIRHHSRTIRVQPDEHDPYPYVPRLDQRSAVGDLGISEQRT
jgi:hypothetical protein